MEFVRLSVDEAQSKFEEFYKGSALTVIGMIPDEAQLYVDYMDEQGCKVDNTKQGFTFEAKAMNEYYKLKGNKKYPDDINIMVIPLDAFNDGGKLALVRLTFSGRWFDDVVDNNAM